MHCLEFSFFSHMKTQTYTLISQLKGNSFDRGEKKKKRRDIEVGYKNCLLLLLSISEFMKLIVEYLKIKSGCVNLWYETRGAINSSSF